MIPTQQDIKNFQMSNHEPKEPSLAVERCGSQELLSGQFRDFDEFSAAAADWDLDFVQLDAGPAQSADGSPGSQILMFAILRFGAPSPS